eukprot:s2900_g9.t1
MRAGGRSIREASQRNVSLSPRRQKTSARRWSWFDAVREHARPGSEMLNRKVELVQSGWVTSSTELCGCRKLEQRSGEGSLRGNGEDTTPTVHPSGLSGAAHGDRGAGSAGLREKSEEGRGFLTPAPSSFNTENDKAAAASTEQLRIGVPALAPRRAGQRNARLRIGRGLRLAVARERGDQSRINGELSAVPEGQAIAHDLDPPGVAGRHIDVHVSDANIPRNTRSGLATDTGKGMLERQRPSRKDTRGGTGGSVVSQRVEAVAAAASVARATQGDCTGLLAVVAQPLPPAEGLGDGPVPELHEVLADARWNYADWQPPPSLGRASRR